MASDHSTPPASPGLGSQMAALTEYVGAFVGALEPDTLLGADAVALYACLARVERLVVGGKTLVAPRICDSGQWERTGHRSAAALLAELDGGATGQARRTLVTGQRLGQLPGTADALRRGELSGAKAAEITAAAVLDPGLEAQLLHGAELEPLATTRERCQRARATAAAADPLAAARRIHAGRHFRHWTDAEGAFCFQGRDTPERGAALLGRLVPTADRIRDARRRLADERERTARAGRAAGTDGGRGQEQVPPPGAEAPHEPDAALWADALFALVTGSTSALAVTPSSAGDPGPAGAPEAPAPPAPPGTPTAPAPAPAPAPGAGAVTPDDGDVLGVRRIIDRPPPATIVVRVDLAALRRGSVAPGERCELDGFGPYPLDLVRTLASDAALSLVFTEAGDIRSVSHHGRTVNARLRTALVYRDRTCVVPGCAMPYGLEVDHIDQFALGGATTLDNLALLCRHHHRMKTTGGWVLARHGPSDEDPRWSFTPEAPFGQEPDLGADRPRPGTGDPRRRDGTDGEGAGGTLFDGVPEIVPRR